MTIKLPHAQYFEGILQVRDSEEKKIDTILEIVKKDARAAVTKIKKVPKGWDLYFSSQHYLRALAKKIHNQFGGTIKVSATLHTRSKMGKDLYRITVLWRPHHFKKADTIKLNGEDWKIIRIANQIQVQHVHSREKKWIRVSDIRTAA